MIGASGAISGVLGMGAGLVVVGLLSLSLLSGIVGALVVASGVWGAALQRLGIPMPVSRTAT